MSVQAATAPPPAAAAQAALAAFLARHRRLFVLTGAGISTGSGIPDYRDADGAWKRTPPITLQAFTGDGHTRRRYWARSLAGWAPFAAARPNAAHHALAELQRKGRVARLLTQNVDGLHQRAGSTGVIDLHGRLDHVACLGCGLRLPRAGFQQQLLACNPGWDAHLAAVAPDGDADLEGVDFAAFQVPDCPACGGMLKPDVVFFGESVPRARVEEATAALHDSDALLVVGSSLMVWSGFRFARMAAEAGIPLAILNRGRTRADGLEAARLEADCARVLPELVAAL
ncbi:NAD-dependent protein deacetylase [Pseudoxanthomonas sp. SGNA-20]|jgi:NAD-dependent protein deacetylases, SIR2 family|uniref:NAD-dependent protein deacetylase n=1 Tax=Pseudoxanthomonas taiwanensis J19 TaxID=935569 RepID=A0A562DZL0_9GAMM|nr:MULTISPECIES: NAD-dependent protein deacetylase [Pseudoxanthomonas]RRN59327.1 NAD-dependent protein deacetylase [Pseudoxanthomonas sp. SGNA-20]RRN79000.1 NAD-dependent protein deacetylase [Pseudoxanthomonas sp. SGD-10]TWH15056.1 NAD-dependent SIR2 family protein deacetylase [Pseudoxanthomonas taiwanensis J19]